MFVIWHDHPGERIGALQNNMAATLPVYDKSDPCQHPYKLLTGQVRRKLHANEFRF